MVNFQNIIHQAESGVAVTVFFDPEITDAQIQQIGQDISMRAEVSKVVFVSAEQAWADFKDDTLIPSVMIIPWRMMRTMRYI